MKKSQGRQRPLRRQHLGWDWRGAREAVLREQGWHFRQRVWGLRVFSSGKLVSFPDCMHVHVHQGACDRPKSQIPAEVVLWLIPKEAELPWLALLTPTLEVFILVQHPGINTQGCLMPGATGREGVQASPPQACASPPRTKEISSTLDTTRT